MSGQTRTRLLVGVLAILVLLVGGRRALDWLGSGASSLGLARSRSLDLEDLDGIEVVALRSDELNRVGTELTPGRDPWRFGQKPAPTPVMPPPQPQPERPQLPSPEPVASAPAAPQPPPIDVTYIGSFGPNRRKIAVFDDGDTVYNALVGDVVKDKFQVVQIGYESVDLTFVGFPDEPPRRLAIGG